MSPVLARILSLHSTREALLASYRGALKLGAELQPASLAGRALERHPDVAEALASLTALDFEHAAARTYLRLVAAEERGRPTVAPVRYLPAISDEGDGRG